MAENNDVCEAYETNADSDSVKCKGCGSNMTFDPETQLLKCSYCGYTEDFNKSHEVTERSIEDALNSNAVWNDETTVMRCENCGARVVAEKTQTACFCPFCGTSHVVATDDLQGIRPNGVVPFKFSKEGAEGNFKTWAKKKLFAPGAFKKSVKTDEMNGVYLPYFTFDSQTNSVYNGRVGYRRTRTVRTKNGTRTETYIVWRNISGSFSHFFDDILVEAGTRVDERNSNKLKPFDFSTACVYENKFLSGFVAHHYEKDIKSCWADAQNDMNAALRNMIIARYNCDQVSFLNVNTCFENVTFKYVMLPVYIINYSYKAKKYVIYQNGSTGKTVGKCPISPWRVLAAIGVGLAALTGLLGLIYHFFI